MPINAIYFLMPHAHAQNEPCCCYTSSISSTVSHQSLVSYREASLVSNSGISKFRNSRIRIFQNSEFTPEVPRKESLFYISMGCLSLNSSENIIRISWYESGFSE